MWIHGDMTFRVVLITFYPVSLASKFDLLFKTLTLAIASKREEVDFSKELKMIPLAFYISRVNYLCLDLVTFTVKVDLQPRPV